MDKKQEASIAWDEHFERKALYEYSKAHLQSEEDGAYIQAVSKHSRHYGMSDFKSALRAEIEKEREKYIYKGLGWKIGSNQFAAYDLAIRVCNKHLELIDETKPKEI